MMRIEKVAVIGSGVMGAGIAAQLANGGADVLLLDMVPEGASSRNQLAESALEKMKKSDPQMLMHRRNLKRITPGNLDDDLKKLSECDWIIEVIIEKLEAKQSLYKKIDEVRKKGSVVSSNTSTLPLKTLTQGMSEDFTRDFMITHFFNPPRYMRLLELVPGTARADAVSAISRFCDVQLGKGVVLCHDTPGFIANRIGVYWLAAALKHALEMNISVEVADEVMGRPVGIPKTGVFGLMDLIGIDLLPLIATSFAQTLPKDDAFFEVYAEHQLIKDMIADGYTGRKGKGGFYRLNTEGGGKVKEAKNLQNGTYAPADKPRLPEVDAARKSLLNLVDADSDAGRYARAVLVDFLGYTAGLVPEIADDILSVDEAMRLGYNWKFGPFELIDKLGAAWLKAALEAAGKPVPALLKKAIEKGGFYQLPPGGGVAEAGAKHADAVGGQPSRNGTPPHDSASKEASSAPPPGGSYRPQFLTTGGDYAAIPVDESAWMLADKKLGKKPVKKNPSASLWDVGDGILCLEFTSKMNALDPMSLEMVQTAVKTVEEEGYKGLIIGNDSENFCVGANIGVLLFAANVAAWKEIDGIIRQGQEAYMALKYAPFPVVAAPAGFAFGGGCEILLHSDAVVAHAETYTGLVEVGVGIVPGWGGCKEMIFRQLKNRAESGAVNAKFGKWFSFLSPVKTLNTMPAIKDAFMNISMAKVAKSADQAQDMLILNEKSRITMNRKRLLADAKTRCLELAEEYTPPHTHPVHLPGKTARTALEMALKGEEKKGNVLPHDLTVSRAVGYVLSGGETDILHELSEQDVLDLEREKFMELVKHPLTLARIEHMLNTGKPLRN